ncbi:hypothetical protein [Streptomyces pseudovenezuelae]|uniref:Integral membrane protein n=1 Tax=Streptomyces pseudovenezuelae TaxID=67350 RepID=A0ABZ1XBA6_9ACTN|nr:hypothetical protein [Streptomyces pseudovenezuelae]
MPRTHRLRGGTHCGHRASGAPVSAAAVLRPMRAALFAAVCVVTTALGHALMSGDLLPWWAVGVAFVATASAGWWLTLRERGVETVVGATVVAQGLQHLLFSLAPGLVSARNTAAGAPEASGVSATHHGMAAMSHSGMLMHHPGTMVRPAEEPLLSVVTHGGSGGMLLAHLLAAVACGVWLWRGEAAVHRIGRALAAALFAPLRRVCRVLFRTAAWCELPSRRAAAGGPECRRSTPAELRHAVVRRGPPRPGTAVCRLSHQPLLAIGS